jgi:hypothetical protein
VKDTRKVNWQSPWTGKVKKDGEVLGKVGGSVAVLFPNDIDVQICRDVDLHPVGEEKAEGEEKQ